MSKNKISDQAKREAVSDLKVSLKIPIMFLPKAQFLSMTCFCALEDGKTCKIRLYVKNRAKEENQFVDTLTAK